MYRAFIAFFIALIAWPGAAFAVATQAPYATDELPYDTCPHVWEFERGGTTDLYELVLRAKTKLTADVNVRLFSASNAYAVSFPAVAIDTPTGTQTLGMRSTALVIHWPISDEPPSAIVSFGGDFAGCRTEARDFKTRIVGHSQPLDAFVKLEKAIAGEANVATVYEVKPDPSKPPACAQEHRDAASEHRAAPGYPQIAKDQDESGTAVELVLLDSAGGVHGIETFSSSGSIALDGAALAAARKSTYLPATAACAVTAGSYVFGRNFTSVTRLNPL